MVTIGDIRFNITTLYPGINLDLLDNWIVAAYNSILDRLNWQHNDGVLVVSTVPEYNTGTLTATQGSAAVVGVGTTWTAAMNGRIIRIGADLEYYGFTYVSATSGTLDRVYLNTGGAGLGYKINQNVIQLPAEARVVQKVSFQDTYTPCVETTLAAIDAFDPGRNFYSDVQSKWAPYMDSATTPPVPQITVWPVPTMARAATVLYTVDNHLSFPLSTATVLLSWVTTQAVIEKVIASCEKDVNAAAKANAMAEVYISDMLMREASQQGPVPLRGDLYFSRRNMARATAASRRPFSVRIS